MYTLNSEKEINTEKEKVENDDILIMYRQW